MTTNQHTTSYYAASAGEIPDYPALKGAHTADVCVIGAGFSGISTALHLAERGYKVHVVESNRVGWGASGRNGGQIIGGISGVHQFVRIGTGCMVGGCTKIGQDLAPYLLADGNPARVPGLNSIGLKRRGVSPETIKTLKAAFKIVYREGLPVKDALAKVDSELGACDELDRFIGFIRESERGILR